MTEIFTAGYEDFDIAGFMAMLSRCGIEMLVDVRELPISRKKGFAKTALSGFCEQNEMEYVHIAQLGCPRAVRHRYREDGDWSAYTVAFKRYLKTQAEPLREIATLAHRRRICLLCFEEDYNFCHRSYVAEAAAPLIGAARIRHLTGPIAGRVVEFAEAQAA